MPHPLEIRSDSVDAERMGLLPEPSWDRDRDLVLWDGRCGFCSRSLAWVLLRDPGRRLAAVPYQLAPAPPMTPALRAACERAVHVVRPNGEVLAAGRACVYIAGVLGYRRLAWFFGLPLLRSGVELGYRLVARNRTRVSALLFRRLPTRTLPE